MSMPAAAEATLDETDSWLMSALPRNVYVADFELGTQAQLFFENKIDGCTWVIEGGAYRSSLAISPDLPESKGSYIRFEPRAGVYFNRRPMTAPETAAFQASHRNEAVSNMGANTAFIGFVDVIDFGDINLSSFATTNSERVYTFSQYLGVVGGEQPGDRQYAFVTSDDSDMVGRYAAAIENAAKLCGATADPF